MEKVALVTGSSSGIGLETVLALARDGYETFASMRDVSKGVELEYAAKKENQWLVEHYYDYPKDPSGFEQWNKTLHQRLEASFAKVETFGK